MFENFIFEQCVWASKYIEGINMVITISRTYGSGGRVMGEKLAKLLGIKFYDRELIRMLSDETGINEALFGESDERLKESYFGTDTDWKNYSQPLRPSDKKYSSESNLFKLQAEMIKKVADSEDCIIMGRCADTILEGRDDVVRIFCYASHENCVLRAMEVCGLGEKEIEKRIAEIDKYRENYYRHFTGKNLYDSNNYDLCLNTGSMTVEELADFVCVYVHARKDKNYIKNLNVDNFNL